MTSKKLFIEKIEHKLNNYATKLYLSDFLREPLVRSVIDVLHLPHGSKGLDIGCGIGSNTLILAEAVGKSGHIVGIDLNKDLLSQAQQRAKKTHLSQQIFFQEADMNTLPFNDNSFDWAWSMDCVGYAPGDAIHLLKDIVRVVKPGGSVSILAWSSQQLIPGYPQLEARLNATSSGIAPFIKGRQPEFHFLRTLGLFKAAGIKEYKARTFVGNVQAPLSDENRKALISLFEMRWGAPKSELTKDDWTEYQRLCRSDSTEFILNCTDYYGFFTYTLFHGRIAE